MSKRYKKSSAGVGALILIFGVCFLISIIQKIWPVLLGVIVVWIGYKLLYVGNKKSMDVRSDYEEDTDSKLSSINLEKDDAYEPSSFVEVPSLKLFGQATHSKNKQFTLVWSNDSANIGGSRNSGLGTYVILAGKDVVKTGRLQRLDDGKIANNASFIFKRSVTSEGLACEIHGFNKDGLELLSYSFKALMLNNGISDDGKYAICQTANAPGDDGNKLFLFDLEKGTLLWKKPPDSGWAYKYEFDTEKGFIYLVYLRLGKFRYDMQGNFLDHEKWMQARIDKGSGVELAYMVSDMSKEVNKSSSEAEMQKLLDICDLAFKRGFENNPGAKAIAFRVQGEVYDLKGELDKAKEKYELALALDPKVGVKRRLDSLKKEISTFRSMPSGAKKINDNVPEKEKRLEKTETISIVGNEFQSVMDERNTDLSKGNKFYELFVELTPLKATGKKKVQYEINKQKYFAEQVGIYFYSACGYEAIWTENDYWSQLVALCFWDVIFENVKGAVVVGDASGNTTALNTNDPNYDKFFQMFVTVNGMPADLFSTDFYERRKGIIKERFDSLRKSDLISEIKASYHLNSGKKCRLIYDWKKFTLEQLLVSPKFINKDAFLGILERIISNINENRSGLPDLFVYKNGDVLFSEVKSEKDKLSDGQKSWHEFLMKKMKTRVEIFHIKN